MATNPGVSIGEITKKEWEAMAVLMSDVSTEILESQKKIQAAQALIQAEKISPKFEAVQAQLLALTQTVAYPPDTGIHAKLDDLQTLLERQKETRRMPYALKAGLCAAGGVLLLLTGLWIGRCTPESAPQSLLLHKLDTVLTERWDRVPTDLQGPVTSAYTQAGLQPPAQRKGKK